MNGNVKTVYVVQVDNNKDLSDAKRFGQLRAVFGSPRKPYNTQIMIHNARKILQHWQEGDYLLMLGDPALCGICTALISEIDPIINILSWDRNTFQYVPQQWDFDSHNFNSSYDNEDEDFYNQ